MDISISVRRKWLASLATFGITPMMSFAASDNGTITVGNLAFPPGSPCISGYFPSSTGSYSPTGLTGGKTLSDLYDISTGSTCGFGSVDSVIHVSGFSSNPGESWLTSVSCNGFTLTVGFSTSYSYSSGIAAWGWSTSGGLEFWHEVGDNLSCTIVHS